jgi:hypothetical protein
VIPLKKGRAQDGTPLERHKKALDKKCARGLIKERYRIRVPGCACRPEPTGNRGNRKDGEIPSHASRCRDRGQEPHKATFRENPGGKARLEEDP